MTRLGHYAGSVALAVAIAGVIMGSIACDESPPATGPTPDASAPAATGEVDVLGAIPHAGSAWTEGLIVEDGVLWESTGRPTGSGVRAIDPDSGEVLWTVSNDDAFFAEGLVRAFGRTYVLSFRESTVFVFDREAAQPFTPFASYDGEGWGLTAVGDALVNSNGSSELFYRDPDTFDVLRTTSVQYEGEPVDQLNELEFDGRYLWANQWRTPYVYRIEEGAPSQVVRYLLPSDFCAEGSPNGIAWDEGQQVFYVTGQLCPQILKVRFH